MAGLRSSIDLLNREGNPEQRLDRIQEHSHSLWNALNSLDGASTLLNVPPSTGLVSFQLAGEKTPADMVKALGRQRIWIRDLADPSCLRACLHVLTSEEEKAQLIEALGKRHQFDA